MIGGPGVSGSGKGLVPLPLTPRPDREKDGDGGWREGGREGAGKGVILFCVYVVREEDGSAMECEGLFSLVVSLTV